VCGEAPCCRGERVGLGDFTTTENNWVMGKWGGEGKRIVGSERCKDRGGEGEVWRGWGLQQAGGEKG